MLTFGCLGLGTSASVGAAGLFCRKPHLQKHGCRPADTNLLKLHTFRSFYTNLFYCFAEKSLGLPISYTMIGASATSILSCKSLYLPANTWSGHGAGVNPLDHGL